MTVSIEIQDFEQLAASGAYGGTRFLSPETELMLITLYTYASLYRWRNENNQPLTDEQRDTIDAWTARAQDELMTNTRIGEIIWSMVNPTNAPDNLLLADGQVISADDYPELADAIGSEWLVSPSPPGVTQYRLPNLISAYASGKESGDMQTRVGANSVQLTEDEMPEHRHATSFATQATLQGELIPVNRYAPSLTGTFTATAGGSQAHENRPLTQYLYPYVIAK